VCDDRDGLLLLNPGSPTERRRAPWHSYGELVIEDGALAARIIRL
jgi:predicted phosphodiesterase